MKGEIFFLFILRSYFRSRRKRDLIKEEKGDILNNKLDKRFDGK